MTTKAISTAIAKKQDQLVRAKANVQKIQAQIKQLKLDLKASKAKK